MIRKFAVEFLGTAILVFLAGGAAMVMFSAVVFGVAAATPMPADHAGEVRQAQSATPADTAANGQFGADTLEAVWAFQEVQGLKVNGVVGPATARALRHPRGYRSRYARGHPMRIEGNLRARVLVVYRAHRVVLISHISAGGGYVFDRGARAVTPTGRFRTTGFLRGWVRVPLGAMYNPVFFIRTAYAIHGEPTYGSNGGGVPLNPVSHGCVRIPYDIALFFHRLVWTPGTPVYIYY